MRLGTKAVLDAVHPGANKAFKTTANLNSLVALVISRSLVVPASAAHSDDSCQDDDEDEGQDDASQGAAGSGRKAKPSVAAGGNSSSLPRSNTLSAGITLGQPIKPMLAKATDLDGVAKKIPFSRLFAEIKYDGERLQVHKNSGTFTFFSRNLKAVPANKTQHVAEHVTRAFPNAKSLVVDTEILIMGQDGKPLPFGTLGVHKRPANTTVALVCFDILLLNGESLLGRPLRERRALLERECR